MGPHWEIYSQQQLYGKCWSWWECLSLIINMLSLDFMWLLVSLPLCAVGWSAVCDFGFSWSYTPAFKAHFLSLFCHKLSNKHLI